MSMFTFAKSERLCRNSLIDKLFSDGKSFMAYPFRITYLLTQNSEIDPAQVLFIVSKKRYKRANKRNLLKRRMREAYRLNKLELYNYLNNNELKIIFAINYISNEILDFSEIHDKMIKAILKLQSELAKKPEEIIK